MKRQRFREQQSPFPPPGGEIIGDWRICQIDDSGSIIKVHEAYLTPDLAYDAIQMKEAGMYMVKKIVTVRRY